jgi:septum formation protein
MTAIDVYLASASPRRRELLQQIGVRFAVLPVAVNEDQQAGEQASAYAERLAIAKAQAGWRMLAPAQRQPVLAADTIVLIDDLILGKPQDRADAIAMLQRLSGRRHQVLTAVALVAGHCSVAVNRSEVGFRPLSLAECEAYWATGEPVDKAGAYAIQGYAAIFVEHLHGSYSGVMGLPIFETAQLLQQANVPVWCQGTL